MISKDRKEIELSIIKVTFSNTFTKSIETFHFSLNAYTSIYSVFNVFVDLKMRAKCIFIFYEKDINAEKVINYQPFENNLKEVSIHSHIAYM